MVRRLVTALVILALTAAALPQAAQAAAAARPRMKVVFVIDSTSYMASLFGGGTKIAAVANALASVLPIHANKIDIGFVVYGHRVSGKEACTGIAPPGPLVPFDATAMGVLFGSLKTKGDASVSLALRQAFAVKDFDEEHTAVLLIAGGPENCSADPCEEAGKLAADHSVPVHVVALDAGGEAEQLQPLKCIADNTKGGFWRVASTMELAAALDDALAAVDKQGAAATPASATPSSTAPATAEAAAGSDATLPLAPTGKAADAQLGLTALLTDAGPLLTNGITWRVFISPGGRKGPIKLVAQSVDANPSFKLPSGDYLINAAFGRAYVTKPMTIAAGTQSAQVVLNAGGLKIGAQLADGSLAPPQLVSCDIFSDQRDQLGNRTKVLSGVKPGVVIRLNSGLYHLAATYGDANATVGSDVGVEAGKITDAVFTLTGAKVTFKLVQQEGGEALTGTSWTIQGAGGEVIKKSLAALPTHILAAGSYTATAERAGKKYTQDFTVKPSEPLLVEVLATADQ